MPTFECPCGEMVEASLEDAGKRVPCSACESNPRAPYTDSHLRWRLARVAVRLLVLHVAWTGLFLLAAFAVPSAGGKYMGSMDVHPGMIALLLAYPASGPLLSWLGFLLGPVRRTARDARHWIVPLQALVPTLSCFAASVGLLYGAFETMSGLLSFAGLGLLALHPFLIALGLVLYHTWHERQKHHWVGEG